MAKKKAFAVPPKLTDAEQDLIRHMELGYQLEADSLGGNLVLRSKSNGVVVRPSSTNRSTVEALQERGLIAPGKDGEPLTITWRCT